MHHSMPYLNSVCRSRKGLKLHWWMTQNQQRNLVFKVADVFRCVVIMQDFRVLVLAPSSLERYLYQSAITLRILSICFFYWRRGNVLAKFCSSSMEQL